MRSLDSNGNVPYVNFNHDNRKVYGNNCNPNNSNANVCGRSEVPTKKSLHWLCFCTFFIQVPNFVPISSIFDCKIIYLVRLIIFNSFISRINIRNVFSFALTFSRMSSLRSVLSLIASKISSIISKILSSQRLPMLCLSFFGKNLEYS